MRMVATHDRPQWQYFGKEPARGGLRGRADARRAGFRLGESASSDCVSIHFRDSSDAKTRAADDSHIRINLIMQHLITVDEFSNSRVPAVVRTPAFRLELGV
jgi:hypothetical protein